MYVKIWRNIKSAELSHINFDEITNLFPALTANIYLFSGVNRVQVNRVRTEASMEVYINILYTYMEGG